jgi:isochorismate synthase
MDSPRLLALANQVLHSLHPTSAVCGMPKQEALSFILEKEGYNRAFYSGFLGPVHLQGQSNLFVNLRCMQLQKTSAILYVGAGITQDSIPCAEWDETVLKSKTLLSVLETPHYAPKTPNPG